MIEIAVSEFARLPQLVKLCGEDSMHLKGLTIDSRQVMDGSIFVAFTGENLDGNQFARPALEAGAGAVVLSRQPDTELVNFAQKQGAALFYCPNPENLLLNLAHWYREQLACVVVGVTGSIGKTTTKDSLAHILSKHFRVHVTQGNFNSVIGLPLTVCAAPRGTEVLILEMGMDGFGQIERLSRCACPNYAIITKIGTSHVGLLGGREQIARAKSEIVAGMPASAQSVLGHSSRLFLSGEDDFSSYIVESAAAPAGIEPLYCGMGANNDVRAYDIRLDEEGHPHFKLRFADGDTVPVHLSLTGQQSVINAVYAAGVAHELGMSAQEIAAAMSDIQLTGHRQEMRVSKLGARIIDDSYNASPESIAAALKLLQQLPCSGKRVAILGEMGELGEEASRMHGLCGAYAAASHLDTLIVVGTSECAAALVEAAGLMGMLPDSVVRVPSVDELMTQFENSFTTGDVVLIKASRFMQLDRFVEKVC
ncbi:UDP-N-acetylmuramoyl-tripeptide--D-alanyl-D-alanine ligase [Collinsella sp. zg1085]|uniref:UDP-N-acetylmuramoyl-tripeptide--D-alanyl-D- alanine ligase n=1 Tax=Collinsella sp. zg1085 TaxID=2844380 RepID=UPI001C0BAA74|nr:UDP-N-acetylmuramoyl-tripeptide--D-alanyl-D-alanine ligase [Collinsella sp. zg1085]QWT18039.1 UDP-N-acetylmuramoyl-tripeptide--D-alanyl-D-alanine ligase [Collinsella sp. zg1085]